MSGVLTSVGMAFTRAPSGIPSHSRLSESRVMSTGAHTCDTRELYIGREKIEEGEERGEREARGEGEVRAEESVAAAACAWWKRHPVRDGGGFTRDHKTT